MKPTKHEDGTETIRIYGKTVDVTGKNTVRVFKRDYKIVRRKPKATKVDIEVTGESKSETVKVANDN